MDLRQTKQYAHYMETLGWSVEQISLRSGDYPPVGEAGRLQQIFIKKIPFLGKVAKLQRPGRVDFEVLDSWCKENKIAVLYVEPGLESRILNLESRVKRAKTCFLPAKTIQIDLTKSEKEILSEMKPKTRYNIGLAKKRGVSIKQSQDIDLFANLWQHSASKRGMFLSQKKEIKALCSAFGKKAHILFAYPKNVSRISYHVSPVARVLLARTATSTHYMYAGSTKEGNKLFAPTLLCWEAIRLAKKRKGKIFDFEGIYDERYPNTRSWQGFTKFKKGFGGKEVIYPPTLVKYYNPVAKFLNL